jgi:hypothetical protein
VRTLLAHSLAAFFSVQTNTVALPKPNGGSVQAVFAWDTLQNALELVTDVPTYLAAAWESEPHDKQPVLVVRPKLRPFASFVTLTPLL